MTYATTLNALSPYLYWQFEETTGATGSVLDASGNSRTGSPAAITFSQSGLIRDGGLAYAFSAGASSYVAADADPPFTDTFTYTAWITPTSTAVTNGGIMSHGLGGGYLRVNAGNLVLLKDQISAICTSTTTVTAGQTYFVAATKSGSTVHLYINGTDVSGSVTNATCVDSGDFWVGRGNGGEYFDGVIDEPAIWSSALTAGNISSLYSAGATITAPVANFSGTPTTLTSGGSVVFTDSSTNTPTSWLWEKNSGSGWVNFAGSPTSQNPTETFS